MKIYLSANVASEVRLNKQLLARALLTYTYIQDKMFNTHKTFETIINEDIFRYGFSYTR